MSGADELDEALALANGPDAEGRSGPGPAPGHEHGHHGHGHGHGHGRTGDGAAAADEAGDGATDPPDDEPDAHHAPGDPDELAAPDWLTPRRTPHHAGSASSTAPRTPSPRGTRPHPGPPSPHPHPHGAGVPWPEARTYAARAAGPLPSLTLPLDRALHHTLDTPLDALTDLPSFDTSAMDGWAVAGPGPWQLAHPPESTGILAGDRSEPRPLADGEAVRIATGARIPPGANAVLRSEYGDVSGPPERSRLDSSRRPGHGTDIRPRGQECRSGDRLLPSGTPVTPAVLGLAAAAGYDELTVTRRPRAEVLVLGDELLRQGTPRDGRIRDALGPMVGPWLAALGAEVLVTRRLGDDAEALHEAMASTTADLVVTTGGTAHGPADHVRSTLDRLGAGLLIDGVRVRPGHPMLLAHLPGSARARGGTSGTHLVGLPGNPLAALSGLMTLAAPLIRTLADLPPLVDPRVPLTDPVPGHPEDTRLVPVAYSPAQSHARPLHYNGPAMLRGIATATALAVVPPGGAAAGAEVRLLPLPWLSVLPW